MPERDRGIWFIGTALPPCIRIYIHYIRILQPPLLSFFLESFLSSDISYLPMDMLETDPISWISPLTPTLGERRLVVAMLQRACLDFWSKDSHLADDARSWFERQSYEPFSFNWICDILGVNRKILWQKIEAAANRSLIEKSGTRYKIKFFNF